MDDKTKDKHMILLKGLIKDYRDAVRRNKDYVKFDTAIDCYLQGLGDTGIKKEKVMEIYEEARELVLNEEKEKRW